MRLFDPSRSLAVLIGMGRHDALPPLQGVANNLRGMSDVLTSAETGRLPPAHLKVLDDRADRITIGKALIKTGILAQDMFLVYFAGHGVVDPDSGELFLAMPETDPSVPPGFSALPYRAFAGLIRGSGARVKLVILDCCFSGRAAAPFMAYGQQALIDQLHIEGTGILAACPPNRTAFDGPDYTRFTGGLLSLLREGIPGGEPYLSLGAIHRRLRQDMISRNLPEPQFLGTANVHELALVPNRAYRRPPPAVERPARLEITAEWGIFDNTPGPDSGYQLRGGNSGLEPKDLDMVLFRFWPGRPDAEEQAGPLVVFSQVHIDDDVLMGLAIHQPSPERDAYGRQTTRINYFRVSQRQLRAHRVSCLELWEALQDAALPADPQRSIHRVVRSIDPEAIDSDIAAFGEATIERTVALLSSGQAVTVLGAGHRPVNERIRFIDAVLHLLPDDAHLPFSAATWYSGLSDPPTIRLAFSDRMRQGTARVDWDSIPSPRDTASELPDLAHLIPRTSRAVAAPVREPSGTPRPERLSALAERAAKAEAPDASPQRAAAASPPASPGSSPRPERLSALAERAAKAEASFEQTLDRARQEAEERYEEKNPRLEKPPTWWKRWKRRVLRLLGPYGRG